MTLTQYENIAQQDGQRPARSTFYSHLCVPRLRPRSHFSPGLQSYDCTKQFHSFRVAHVERLSRDFFPFACACYAPLRIARGSAMRTKLCALFHEILRNPASHPNRGCRRICYEVYKYNKFYAEKLRRGLDGQTVNVEQGAIGLSWGVSSLNEL